jgi:hypothetical protein
MKGPHFLSVWLLCFAKRFAKVDEADVVAGEIKLR